MNPMGISPWLHILVAYLIYILIAVLTSLVVGKVAGDLKDFKTRNSLPVLLMGAAANLLAMIAVLLLLVLWDQRPVSALGLGFRERDALAALGGLLLTFLLAIAYLYFLRSAGRIESITVRRSTNSSTRWNGMGIGLLALLAIVLQEEVLNRGYVTLNLLPLGPWGIILASTVIFVAIHFLTNRGSLPQVISWTVSGLVLVISYLLSGSIWVPIILHYATDAANVLVFNITGQYAFFQAMPEISEGQRTAFRVVYGFVMIAILFAMYGFTFQFK